jgi:hypothetical protein
LKRRTLLRLNTKSFLYIYRFIPEVVPRLIQSVDRCAIVHKFLPFLQDFGDFRTAQISRWFFTIQTIVFSNVTRFSTCLIGRWICPRVFTTFLSLSTISRQHKIDPCLIFFSFQSAGALRIRTMGGTIKLLIFCSSSRRSQQWTLACYWRCSWYLRCNQEEQKHLDILFIFNS